MRARIHEMILTDGPCCSSGKTYDVPDLDNELNRLDQSGAIFMIAGSAPAPEIDGLHVWIIFFV